VLGARCCFEIKGESGDDSLALYVNLCRITWATNCENLVLGRIPKFVLFFFLLYCSPFTSPVRLCKAMLAQIGTS
jgi:hypothetical protein